MKLEFDPNQQYQLDAVTAVADIFEGQPQSSSDFSVIQSHWGDDNLYTGIVRTELGIANQPVISDSSLFQNTQVVQVRNDIEIPQDKRTLDAWELIDSVSEEGSSSFTGISGSVGPHQTKDNLSHRIRHSQIDR